MSRRKGELTGAEIDRRWPHQIMLPSDTSPDHGYDARRAFCAANGLDHAPYGHAIFEDGRWHNVFCFAEHSHAALFRARFGGEWLQPGRRGVGRAWQRLKPETPARRRR